MKDMIVERRKMLASRLFNLEIEIHHSTSDRLGDMLRMAEDLRIRIEEIDIILKLWQVRQSTISGNHL